MRNYLEVTFETDVVNIYGASESLALGVETSHEAGSPYPFTMAGNIMGRNEDLMWFEDWHGNRDFL